MTKGIVLIMIGGLAVAQAGVYTQDFNAAAHMSTDLGDGTTIRSSGGHAMVYDTGSWRALRLTQDQVTGQTGNFALYDLDAGSAITEFTASFTSQIKGGASPADGFSFNFGQLPALPNGGEWGMTSSSMLSIGWDTYADGGRAVEIFVDGSSVYRSAVTPVIETTLGNTFQTTTIHWDENGLDVDYAGQNVCNDFNVSGFSATAGDRFAFAARTGADYQDVFIDDLNVSTIPEPATLGLAVMFGSGVFFVRRIFAI